MTSRTTLMKFSSSSNNRCLCSKHHLNLWPLELSPNNHSSELTLNSSSLGCHLNNHSSIFSVSSQSISKERTPSEHLSKRKRLEPSEVRDFLEANHLR